MPNTIFLYINFLGKFVPRPTTNTQKNRTVGNLTWPHWENRPQGNHHYWRNLASRYFIPPLQLTWPLSLLGLAFLKFLPKFLAAILLTSFQSNWASCFWENHVPNIMCVFSSAAGLFYNFITPKSLTPNS